MLNFLVDTNMTRMYWYMMSTLTIDVSMPSGVDGHGWYTDVIGNYWLVEVLIMMMAKVPNGISMQLVSDGERFWTDVTDKPWLRLGLVQMDKVQFAILSWQLIIF